VLMIIEHSLGRLDQFAEPLRELNRQVPIQ
jgi:hypothetical protein